MRRGDLLRRVGQAAKSKKLKWLLERQGKKHEIWAMWLDEISGDRDTGRSTS
jgi:hypothetical protein